MMVSRILSNMSGSSTLRPLDTYKKGGGNITVGTNPNKISAVINEAL